MRNGFTYRERHSSEFGVTVRTKSRPIRPPVKGYTAELPLRDGSYDFSAANTNGREYYSERIFTVSLSVAADNIYDLERKVGLISLWLSEDGYGNLIFDDLPVIVWSARISDEIIYMPERGGRNAVIEVSFRVKPFGTCIFGKEGPMLDNGVLLDSALPLEMESNYKFELARGATISIMNYGDRPVRPTITITGNGGTITLAMNGQSFYFQSKTTAVVDFEKRRVFVGNSPIKVTGSFFEFTRGKNSLAIVKTSSAKLTVTVDLKPEFMYNADFSQLDWG